MLPEAYRRVVVKLNGDVAQTVLVDGLVVAMWRFEDRRVVSEPFVRLSPAVRWEVEDEAERLAAFLSVDT